jgi:hypothetical protein
MTNRKIENWTPKEKETTFNALNSLNNYGFLFNPEDKQLLKELEKEI